MSRKTSLGLEQQLRVRATTQSYITAAANRGRRLTVSISVVYSRLLEFISRADSYWKDKPGEMFPSFVQNKSVFQLRQPGIDMAFP